MNLNNIQFDHIVDALNIILPLRSPADVSLHYFFRDRPKLGSRDRALIAETVYMILRRRRLLETLAPQGTPRELALLALAKLGGANIRELEPLLRKGEAEWLASAKGTDISALPLAVQTDLPDWIADRLVAQYGEAETIELARALREAAPLDVRVNTMLANRDEVLKVLQQDGFAAVPTPYSPFGIRLEGKPALQHHPLFLSGKVEVQDEGSQLLGLLLSPKRREMVVDFCAGAGGKTLLIGALMHSQGRIYALDVSEKRLNNLKPRLARSGLSNVQPQRIDNERDTKIKRLAGKIDRVLVDAPCTGSGTWRRAPHLKWTTTRQQIATAAAVQQTLLGEFSERVRPGGRLLYATCSLNQSENSAVVAEFLKHHVHFELEPPHRHYHGVVADAGLTLLPALHNTDGFFIAAFRRRIESGERVLAR